MTPNPHHAQAALLRRVHRRAGIVLAAIALSLVAMTGQIININTTQSPRLTGLARSQQIATRVIPAHRGFIFDRTGRVVAATRTTPSVFADPGLIDGLENTAALLSPIIDLPTAEIARTLARRPGLRFCWLKRNIADADADAVRNLKLPGIGIRFESRREFPLNNLMANTIGIVGREGAGLEGVEKAFDGHLRGQDGVHTSVYDGRKQRQPIWMDKDGSRPERDGGHVVLTLDAVIQGYLDEQLELTAEHFAAQAVVGVVMSPKTGAVFAMGQYPAFDPNRYADFPADQRRNRAVCDAVEPGSIFKPFVAAGALLNRVVDPREEIFCHEGLHWFDRRRMRDTSPHGNLDIRGIIAKSSNIGMGILGHRMGNAAIHDIVTAFGFGSPAGVRFPGDSPGIVHPLAQWTSYSTTSVPIGQEITVTPLQMATAFCAIVNGGVLLRPYVVEKLLAPDGAVKESFAGPNLVRRVLPQPLADYMRLELLPAVVEDGGGFRAALADWRVGGKTGTAEVPYKNHRGYEPGAYIGSFIAAAPIEDPEIVVLVMTHRPDATKGYYGGVVSAPAVRNIMEKTLAYLHVPPSPRRLNVEIAKHHP